MMRSSKRARKTINSHVIHRGRRGVRVAQRAAGGRRRLHFSLFVVCCQFFVWVYQGMILARALGLACPVRSTRRNSWCSFKPGILDTTENPDLIGSHSVHSCCAWGGSSNAADSSSAAVRR